MISQALGSAKQGPVSCVPECSQTRILWSSFITSSLLKTILPYYRHSCQVHTLNLPKIHNSSKITRHSGDSFPYTSSKTSRTPSCKLTHCKSSSWLLHPSMFQYSNIHYTECYYAELGYYIQGNGKYKQQHILLFSTHYCLLCSEEFRDRNSHWIIWSGFLQTPDHEHSFTHQGYG